MLNAGEGLVCLASTTCSRPQKSVLTNQIAERPIRSILSLRDVTLSWNVQIQHAKNAFVERAGLLYMREVLAVSFDRLASHLFLVVGHEIHGESFVIAILCLVCGMCTCAYLNGKMIASLHSI